MSVFSDRSHLDPLVSGSGPGKGNTVSVDETWTNTGGARDVTVTFQDPSGFAIHYEWDLALSWPGCAPVAGNPLDADSQVGGGGPATPCLDACGSSGGMWQALQRRFGDPVDVSRGALVESVTDMSVAARGPALGVARSYDSAAAQAGVSGVFGVGWSSLLDSSLSVDTSGADPVAVWRQPSGAKVSFVDDGSGWVPELSSVTAVLSESGGAFSVRTGAGTSYGFEAGSSGVLRLVSVTDRNGYVLSLGWSANQVQLVARTKPGAGAPSAASLDVGLSGGQVTQVQDAAGRKVTYGFSGDDLVSVSSLGGGSWSYTYAGGHLLTNMVDPAGAEAVNQYDAEGRVVLQWDPNAAAVGGSLDPQTATAFDYGDLADGSGTVTVTAPNGAVTEQTYSGGLLVSEVQGAGTGDAQSSEFDYDPSSGLATVAIGPDKSMSTMSYTPEGWLAEEVSPSGATTTYSNFDAFGNPGTVTDPSGVTTTFSYDANGNLKSVSRPWGSTTRETIYGRDSDRPDDVLSVIQPEGLLHESVTSDLAC